MSRAVSLLAAFVGLAMALWLLPAGAHDGPHAAATAVSSTGTQLSSTLSEARPSPGADSVIGPSSCPGEGGNGCCCRFDGCIGSSEPRLLAATATDAIVRQCCAPSRPVPAGGDVAATFHHPVASLGSRGPPASS